MGVNQGQPWIQHPRVPVTCTSSRGMGFWNRGKCLPPAPCRRTPQHMPQRVARIRGGRGCLAPWYPCYPPSPPTTPGIPGIPPSHEPRPARSSHALRTIPTALASCPTTSPSSSSYTRTGRSSWPTSTGCASTRQVRWFVRGRWVRCGSGCNVYPPLPARVPAFGCYLGPGCSPGLLGLGWTGNAHK